MSILLTLTEVMNISVCYPDRSHFARAIQEALLKKIKQNPVAWIDSNQLAQMQIPQMSRVTFQTYLQATEVWPGTIPLYALGPYEELDDGPGEEDGPWAKGWEERCGIKPPSS